MAIFSTSSCLPIACTTELHVAADETGLVGSLANSFTETRFTTKTQPKAALGQDVDSNTVQAVKAPWPLQSTILTQ